MHLKFPSTMITKREDSASASSIEWVVRIIVDCFSSVDIFDMTLHINLFALGSIPVDGSSMNMIGGLPIIAIATDSLRLFPPERFLERVLSYISKSSSLIFSLTIWSFLFEGKHFIS